MPSPHPAPLSRMVAAGELLAIEPPGRGDADGNPTFAMEFLSLRWNPWARANEVLGFRGWNTVGTLDLLCVPTIAAPWSDIADTMQSSLEAGAGRLGGEPSAWPLQACLAQLPQTVQGSRPPCCHPRPA